MNPFGRCAHVIERISLHCTTIGPIQRVCDRSKWTVILERASTAKTQAELAGHNMGCHSGEGEYSKNQAELAGHNRIVKIG
mmetsp:Transcript_100590/g.178507  ORF Transcript_100590/g.178507 Transcript_100590/m.178507 type:complete len:81 (-) Transcript_100590:1274-1516(-)